MRTRLKVILLPGLLAVWLCCASPAAADSIGIVDISVLDDGMSDIPPADLVGWFQTFDPSIQWTSAANIATMESWLDLVENPGNDPSLLPQLDGLGINNLSSIAPSPAGQSLVPEPATLELLGGALAILGYVSLRRFD